MSNNLIQTGLDFRCQQSVAVWALSAVDALGILPRRLHRHCGASVVTARDAVATEWRIPMKLTDTQLVLLSAAAQREDGTVEIGPKLKGSAPQKVLSRLLSEH